MHLGIPALLEFYRNHREQDSLVLATITGTEGSTYRKPGAMMLIEPGGGFEGMISGGCLEGDLMQHAEAVFQSGEPAFVTYDMHAGEDLVWSLGLGCDGIIHLLLQRLDRVNGFGFLQHLEEAHAAGANALLALVTGEGGGYVPGACGLLDSTGRESGEPALNAVLQAHSKPWPDWRFLDLAAGQSALDGRVMLVNARRQTRALICGAGPDAVPLARQLTQLNWQVQVMDHRPDYARSSRFPEACQVVLARPEQLDQHLDAAGIDAAIIMSHHLENDARYLERLAPARIPYIGLLGPRARRARLSEMAGVDLSRAHGPAGLEIGAELPEAIALSVAAEMHAVLNDRDGQKLTLRADAESR